MSMIGFHEEHTKDSNSQQKPSVDSHLDNMDLNEYMKGFDDLTDFSHDLEHLGVHMPDASVSQQRNEGEAVAPAAVENQTKTFENG